MDIGSVLNRKEFKNSLQKCVVNLFYTSNYIRDKHKKLFDKYHIQGQHYNVLRILGFSHPEPLYTGKIKEVMVDKGHDLTRLLDKLESFQWIKRQRSPENKRKILVSLTEDGFKINQDIYVELDALIESFRLMDEKEYELLSNLLDKMRKDE